MPSTQSESENLATGFFLPGRIRSPIDSISFANCTTEADLPSRLIFGKLVPQSFKPLPKGFQARYASTYITSTLVAKGAALSLEVKVNHADAFYHIYHDWTTDSSQSLLCLLAATKPKIDGVLKSIFQAEYNVSYKCGELPEGVGHACYLPDGFAVSILVPFPVNDASCANLFRFIDAVQAGPEIFCQGRLEQQVIVTNYREGLCPDLQLEPSAILLRDINRGLIPLGIPVWQGNPHNRALTAKRTGYILIIETFLHDLADILKRLHACNLIKEDATSELIAQVHDSHFVEGIQQCAAFSRDRSRRVVLGFTNPNAVPKDQPPTSSRRVFEEHLQGISNRVQELNQPLLKLLSEDR